MWPKRAGDPVVVPGQGGECSTALRKQGSVPLRNGVNPQVLWPAGTSVLPFVTHEPLRLMPALILFLAAAGRSLHAMGESPLWFWKLLAWKDRAQEGQPIVQKDQRAETEKSSYASINGGETAGVSCVPCASITSQSSVTCPTCQGTGRIPRGRFCSPVLFWPNL